MGASSNFEVRMTDHPWRDNAAYAYLDDLTSAALGWEFLRRNPDYQSDYSSMRKEASCAAAAIPMGAGRDWGLVFRGRSSAHLRGAAGLLAA